MILSRFLFDKVDVSSVMLLRIYSIDLKTMSNHIIIPTDCECHLECFGLTTGME